MPILSETWDSIFSGSKIAKISLPVSFKSAILNTNKSKLEGAKSDQLQPKPKSCKKILYFKIIPRLEDSKTLFAARLQI